MSGQASIPLEYPIENLIHNLADHVDDVILITEAEPKRQNGPKILWANKRFEEMTGYTLNEVVGQTPRILQGPDTDPEVRRRIGESLDAWRPVRERLKNYRKDGTPFWVELSIRPVADRNGWYHYWMAIQRDVTEQVAQEQALEHALYAATSAERTQSLFLSTISHEIKTPLNGILGVSQILEMLGPLNKEQRDAVESQRQAGEVLLKLVDDLLDISLIRSGKPSIQKEPVFADDVVQKAVIAQKTAAEAKGLEIWTNIESHAKLAFLSDERRVLQILVNLLGNAVKFTSNGHIEISVRRVAPDEIFFEVSDTGHGVPEEHLEEIFEPFRQIDSGVAREHDGAGLGLAISQEFAGMLGGRITVKSEVGIGSTFRLSLPAKSLIDCTEPEVTKAPSHKGWSVLIVEDDKMSLTITEWAFKHKGWNVFLFQSGEAVMEAVEKLVPDLIVLDRHLPGISGDEILSRLKSGPHALAEIPVVMMTADASITAERQTLKAGASRFFSKPVDLESLVKVSEELVILRETSAD